ncbi:hypothetical protein ScPMuIL_015565 [Solemya velum]
MLARTVQSSLTTFWITSSLGPGLVTLKESDGHNHDNAICAAASCWLKILHHGTDTKCSPSHQCNFLLFLSHNLSTVVHRS